MMLLHDDIRAVMWFAVIPACISVAILVLFVREPAPKKTHQARRVPIKAREIGALGRQDGSRTAAGDGGSWWWGWRR